MSHLGSSCTLYLSGMIIRHSGVIGICPDYFYPKVGIIHGANSVNGGQTCMASDQQRNRLVYCKGACSVQALCTKTASSLATGK